MSLQEQINLIDQQLKAAEGEYKEALLAKKAVRVARLEVEAPGETKEAAPKRKRTNAISKAVEEPVEEVKEEPVIDEAPVEESA